MAPRGVYQGISPHTLEASKARVDRDKSKSLLLKWERSIRNSNVHR